MSTLEENEKADCSPAGLATQVNDGESSFIENNSASEHHGREKSPPAAVEVRTPIKPLQDLSGTQPIVVSEAKSPTTPTTPKTPMTQDGSRSYRALFGELKKRYKEQQGVNIQLRSEIDKSERECNELRNLVAAFKSQNEHLLQQCSDMKSQQEREVKLTRRLSEDDFKTKSKSKKAKPTDEDLKCENANCVNSNEDTLIKCHACGKWICETCSEARISKLKPIMKNCDTLFFACRNCVSKAGDAAIVVNCENGAEGNEQVELKSPDVLVSSMKTLLKDHVTQIEEKIEKMIEKKLEDKRTVSPADGKIPIDQQNSSAKGILKVPEELRKIMQEAKNDDKVEESEQEKRATNFIIHGAEEFGDGVENSKKIDNEYLDDILKHLGITGKPENIIRIGDPKKSSSRPIKVTMKSKADKNAVMSRLNRLKDTEDEFGKISITEDYTQTEREMIKTWSTKAKEKTDADKDHVYKVRGDPKNGLRLVRFKRKN